MGPKLCSAMFPWAGTVASPLELLAEQEGNYCCSFKLQLGKTLLILI